MPKLHKIGFTFKFHPLHAKISTPTATHVPDEKVKELSSRDTIESKLSVAGIQGCHEDALCKNFETSPHLICLYASTNIP